MHATYLMNLIQLSWWIQRCSALGLLRGISLVWSLDQPLLNQHKETFVDFRTRFYFVYIAHHWTLSAVTCSNALTGRKRHKTKMHRNRPEVTDGGVDTSDLPGSLLGDSNTVLALIAAEDNAATFRSSNMLSKISNVPAWFLTEISRWFWLGRTLVIVLSLWSIAPVAHLREATSRRALDGESE